MQIASLKRQPIFSSHLSLYMLLNVIVIMNALMNWPIVKLSGIKQALDYGDIRTILRAADCYKYLGEKIYSQIDGPCVYNYGQPLIWLVRALRLGEKNTVSVGIFLFLITIASFVVLIRILVPELNYKNFAVITLLFCSPPVMLLFERANPDSLIFCALVGTVLFGFSRWKLLRWITLGAASTFKFYTSPLLFTEISRIKKSNSLKYGLVLLFVFIINTSIVRDLNLVLRGFSVPNPMFNAFGSSKSAFIIGKIFGINFSRIEMVLFGFLAALIFIYFLRKTSESFKRS